jgi:hypothetical protein
MDGDEAAKKIERENEKVDAIVVPVGYVVIMDFRCNRVWVWVDNSGGCTYTSGGAHAYPQHLKTPHTILFISVLHLLDN